MKSKIYIIDHIELDDSILVAANSITEAIQKFLSHYKNKKLEEKDIENIGIYDDGAEIII